VWKQAAEQELWLACGKQVQKIDTGTREMVAESRVGSQADVGKLIRVGECKGEKYLVTGSGAENVNV
jgi:hypothetical protein